MHASCRTTASMLCLQALLACMVQAAWSDCMSPALPTSRGKLVRGRERCASDDVRVCAKMHPAGAHVRTQEKPH